MKHIKHYKVFEASPALTPEQIEWLGKCTTGNWDLNLRTGEVDVFHGGFDCSEQDLSDFKGVRFGVVEWHFYCSDNLLTSLEGAPREVGGDFWCENNQLTSLEGAPRKVGGDFDCGSNRLTSLEGAPEKVEGNFWCRDNRLTSLEGAPEKVRGDLSCGNNLLTSLVGAPREVGDHFDCGNNLLTSLEGAPEKVRGSFFCFDNPVSDETLKSIFSRMEKGGSYMEAVESLWPKIPVDDQALLYRPEFKWIGAEEAKKLQAVGRFNKIKGIL